MVHCSATCLYGMFAGMTMDQTLSACNGMIACNNIIPYVILSHSEGIATIMLLLLQLLQLVLCQVSSANSGAP